MQPVGQTSWLGPLAQVGGVQALLPAPVGMQRTGQVIASGDGVLPPQLSAMAPAAAPTTVNASTAGIRSAMAAP
jgi:hypothetical protein